ncbi:hypothetical protein [Qaidamihabitans albus]|uniref:hypothetical protein n=1 Tax=Qaidamihabitans albus TaxID=2795733 RepID=UPI001F17DBFE|nr:hypothetical protein [Qaidamihabitans albus]
MNQNEQDQQHDQQEYLDRVAEREANRSAPVENDAGVIDEPEAQPGRAAVSRRTTEADPTGNLNPTDLPPEGKDTAEG